MSGDLADIGHAIASRLGRPARLLAVGLVAVLLLIPLEMVQSVVRERHATYREVVTDIAGAWSSDQVLAGPLLAVPFTERVEVRGDDSQQSGTEGAPPRWTTCRRRAVLLPSSLDIGAVLIPEERRRGIYRVQVYTAEIELSAAFRNLESSVRSLRPEDRLVEVHWEEAVLVFGLSDPRGIVEVGGLEVAGEGAQARPGTTLGETLPRGFHVAVGGVSADGFEVRMPMVIRGSGGFSFLPVGATTRATVGSTWPHPSFSGDVLPAAREITDEGFSARWTIPLLNRSYPQAWIDDGAVGMDEIVAGVRLFQPVALYDLVTRAVKYGLLFVVLTFLTLGLIELILGIRLSLVQFLLVGVALALFFLILVALAEHLGFTLAYVLASSIVVVMNTLYCGAILRRRTSAVLLGAVLTAIYGVLYTILEAEDYALLGGTTLLVTALAVTMFVTRRLHEPDAETRGASR